MKKIKVEKEQRKEAEMKRFLRKKETIDVNAKKAIEALEETKMIKKDRSLLRQKEFEEKQRMKAK